MSETAESSTSTIPYRQIRALYTDTTITVYQAYSASIALPAVTHQRLSASPDFEFTRMTWIKPSFTWMLYRSGYSYKDPRQAHILALTMTRESFEYLLSLSSLSGASGEKKEVRVQWDPERSVQLGRLEHRSLQVGIGRNVSRRWVEEMVVGIEDVTEVAREVKRCVDEGRVEEAKALLPREREYVLGEELRGVLGMDREE